MNLFAGFMLLLIVYKTNGSFTPMVAFMCGKPSMYMSDKGWQGVEDVDCLHDPVDMLNFCRRAYPGKKVTNVVQSSAKVTISNWCSVDKPNCPNAEHTVAPYKCIVGEFQSEALLVPEHCEFEHELDEQLCQEVSVWQDTAAKACLDRGLTLDSSAPLSVCGVARFHGVEFVCCPAKTKEVKEKNVLSSSGSSKKNNGDEREDDGVGRDSDILRKYLRTSSDKDESEHDRYSRAKADLTREHEDRMAKVMKEWAAARLHVQQVKQSDPKRAEKLEQQATKRFQETYSALAEELKMEKLQLSRVHEQRVQADFNEKKRVAMDNYMDTLNDDASKAEEIAKALKAYIRLEQKDRLHTVNHYEHILNTDRERAGDERPHIIDHLKVVSKRIERAVNMLSRVPRLEKKIRVQIAQFMKDSFHDVDVTVAAILVEPASSLLKDKVQPEVKVDNKKAAAKLDDGLPVIGQQTHQSVVKKDGVEEKPETPFSSSTGNGKSIEDDDYDEDSYEVDEGELVTLSTTTTSAPKVEDSQVTEAKKAEKIDFNSEKFDDETMEDEHYLLDDAELSIAHHEVDGLAAESQSISRGASVVETSASKTAIVSLFVATVTLFVVVAVGIAVLRQKSREGHCEVDADDDMSPEDRHVSAMQANGYENPTYKFFENRA